ncbi:MAG: hypothetical protein ACP5QO_07235 [Clostridia bacterium]
MRDDLTDLTDVTDVTVETILADIGGVVLLPAALFWHRLETELGPQAPVRPQDVFCRAEDPWDRCRAGQLANPLACGRWWTSWASTRGGWRHALRV